jgi:DNA-binding GntR family transcriptional regulator
MRPPSPVADVRRSQSQVYDQLRDLVVTGQIAPGSRLLEAEVASQLRVSRTPAREAMRRLAQEGLAQSVGAGKRRQMAVAPVTRADLADLFLIVGSLEGVAGRGVIALSPAERRSLAAQLAALNARFTALARARSRDFPRFFEAHDAFHRCFVEQCASERLRHLLDAVRPQVKRYELLYASVVGRDFSESLAEHRAIIAAFRSGTAEAVEGAIRRNWSNSANRLVAGSAPAGIRDLGDYRARNRDR